MRWTWPDLARFKWLVLHSIRLDYNWSLAYPQIMGDVAKRNIGLLSVIETNHLFRFPGSKLFLFYSGQQLKSFSFATGKQVALLDLGAYVRAASYELLLSKAVLLGLALQTGLNIPVLLFIQVVELNATITATILLQSTLPAISDCHRPFLSPQIVGAVQLEAQSGHTEIVAFNLASGKSTITTDIPVNFRGSIHTTITESGSNLTGSSDTTYRQTVSLFRVDKPLWDSGTALPASGSHVLAFPFEFQLPQDLPPSFHCHVLDRTAAISYSLEIVGDRPGLFHRNRRVRRLISVVPAASNQQWLAKESLRQGFRGAWKLAGIDKKMRKGIWSNYSYAPEPVALQLLMPDLPSFPIATDIPFSFHVIMHTKPMRRSERPVDKHGAPLFPAPPALSSEVKLALLRKTNIRAKSYHGFGNEVFKLKESLGDATCVGAVRAVTDAAEWLPDPNPKDDKNHGVWKRAVHFESAVALHFAPTFTGETVDWEYKLRFEVLFPGIGNNIKLEVPIRLDPGSACPPPPIGAAGSSRITYADILPAGPPPPMEDLPPSYWAGVHNDWNDEKK
ncbi:hypothetical protein C8J57DRAFT_1707454 [Mycena rebaudengoi]|nr:hypothetical protein C8J57DRAFT_1707454 [Mycena rebaudengoi]